MIGGSNPCKGWEFFSSPSARGPTQFPIQWVPGALFVGAKGPGRETYLQLVPRSRIRGATPPLPQIAFMAWCSVKAQGFGGCSEHGNEPSGSIKGG